MNKILLTVAIALVFSRGNASAIVLATDDYNSAAFLSSQTAVASITIGNRSCSGSLLYTGAHVLTAAHCLFDSSGGLLSGTPQISFVGSNQQLFTYSGAGSRIHESFNPNNLFAGNDLAVISLSSIADASINRLSIWNGGYEVGYRATLVGYGLTGSGSTGAIPGTNGTRREGVNDIDNLNFAQNVLLFDFDNGQSNRSTLGGLGAGTSEAMMGLGDSGGAVLINGKIAGIMSYLSCLSNDGRTCDTSIDVDGSLNSTYGERFGATRTSIYSNWIASNAVYVQEPQTTVPEPTSFVEAIGALCLGGFMRARSRSRNK